MFSCWSFQLAGLTGRVSELPLMVLFLGTVLFGSFNFGGSFPSFVCFTFKPYPEEVKITQTEVHSSWYHTTTSSSLATVSSCQV